MQSKRETIGKRDDRRVRRTKKLLEQGLVQLLEEKPIHSITVRELTNLIDINRGTFYLYYQDIYDMVEKLEEEYISRLIAMLDKHQEEDLSVRVKEVSRELFAFIEENKRLCKVLLSENGDIHFLQSLNSVIHDRYRGFHERLRMDEATFEYRYAFTVFGLLGVIRRWLAADCDWPAEKMAALAEMSIRTGVFRQS